LFPGKGERFSKKANNESSEAIKRTIGSPAVQDKQEKEEWLNTVCREERTAAYKVALEEDGRPFPLNGWGKRIRMNGNLLRKKRC